MRVRTGGSPTVGRMEMHFATIWESIADEIPDVPAVTNGDTTRTWSQFDDRAARVAQALHRRRARTRLQGRALPLQRQRVRRGAVRHVQAPRRPDQRQLPLPRRRTLVPARQLRCRGAGVPLLARRSRRQRRRPTPQAEAPHRGRRRRRPAGVPSARSTKRSSPSHDPMPRIVRAEDDIYMLYTGGTTGMPKGVMYSIGRTHQGPGRRRASR